MADTFTDPTAAGAIYADPTAPVFTAPIVRPEPDPVYRDDALFASAGANWRPPPVPVPPVPVLNQDGELVLEPRVLTAAELRTDAVDALHAPRGAATGLTRAPTGGPRPPVAPAPGSRGGARSTYAAPAPVRGDRRPPPARPSGSVTTSPSTWLPVPAPTPTSPWRTAAPAPTPTWRPPAPTPTYVSSGGAPGTATGQVTYPATGRGSRPGGGRKRSGKGWIPGVIVLAFVVLANVVPHLGGILHRGAPAGVDRTVDGYYDHVESGDVAAAAKLVCSTLRTSWTSGQSASDSDSGRDIIDHSITSTHSDGSSNYTVVVHLELSAAGSGSDTATLKVLKDGSGDYRVCGGTNP